MGLFSVYFPYLKKKKKNLEQPLSTRADDYVN